MFYHTESKPQGWRAVAVFKDERADCLLFLGRSSRRNQYACRAATQWAFSFGDAESRLVDFGWYATNSEKRTHEVGQKGANLTIEFNTGIVGTADGVAKRKANGENEKQHPGRGASH